MDEIVGDPRIPEQIKASLRDGGIRAQVHQQLLERATIVEAELNEGEQGRDRLLQDPKLSAGIKEQLANIPSRALREPAVIAGISGLFRDAILARENALVVATAQQSLKTVRAAMSVYAAELVERIQRGIKVAFATSIAHMLGRALWIVALAMIVVLFIPELPLRSKGGGKRLAVGG